MPRTRSSAAFTELILEVFRVNGRLLSAGDALTRPAGQTSARWQVLGALEDGPRTVAEIGRRMGLTRQSVQRTADLLAADGLISYSDNPAHQRAQLAALTSRGRSTLYAIESSQIEWANRVASRLREADLNAALRTLKGVREAVDVAAAAGRNRRHGQSAATPRRSAIRTKPGSQP